MSVIGSLFRSWWRGITGLFALALTGLAALRTRPVARRHAVIVAAAFLVFGYAGGVLSYVVLSPEIGIRSVFAPVVSHFHPEFLYPDTQQHSLAAGDQIVWVGEKRIKNWPDLLRALRDVGAQPAVAVDLETFLQDSERKDLAGVVILPDGQKVVRVRAKTGEAEPRDVWCRIGHPPAENLLPSLLWFFLKIGLFVVGAIVFWKRTEDRAAAQFFLLCIVSLGAYIGGYHWTQILTQQVLLLVFMICSIFFPAVILHFYLLFPRPKVFLESRPWWPLVLLYGPPLFFLSLIFSGYLRVRWLFQGGVTDQSQGAMQLLLGEILGEIYVYFGIAAVYYLCGVISLLHSYRQAADAVERNQVRWILFGAAAALMPIGYSFYLAFWRPDRFAAGAATWPMFAASVCITVAFTISITRYRLMQLDQAINSGMVYFLISSLAGLIYYGLVFTGMLLVGSRVSEGPSLGQALTVSTTALVLLLILDLVRIRLKSALDRHYRREKNQLDHTLQRMRQAVEQLVDPPALARRLLHTAAELLGVARGAVYLRQGQPPLYHLADTLGPAPSLTELSSGCPLVETLQAEGGLWIKPRTAPADPAQRQLQFLGGEVATALVHEGQLLGLLVLGSRESSVYAPEDLNLLTAFAQLTVLALVSAEGHRTIQALNRELQTKVEKIAEQQRRIVILQSQLMKSAHRDEEQGPKSAERGEVQESTVPVPDATPAATHAEYLEPQSSLAANGLIGSSSRIRQLLYLVRKVAASASAVLLRGESGTGKEVLARVLHENSPRAGKAFVKVHCAALAGGLLESELFGHVKGAFTNAIRDKVGRFEAADGGTLFLDEIGDINLEVQTKLLRVLQEMTFERVGSSEPVKVDVRIIAATHQDLEELMREGRFREDLFYRLNVFPITVPPLREHVEDIPELATHFLGLYGRRSGKDLTGIEDDALAVLKGFSWPGNIRQLENVIERAVVIADGPIITVQELPGELLEQYVPPLPPAVAQRGSDDTWIPMHSLDRMNGAGGPLVTMPDLSGLVQSERLEKERRERETLVRALAAAAGNKSEAARALGVARSTLLSRLKRLGLG